MYMGKPCIVMIFDKSFIIYDVQVPVNIIFTLMNHNKDAYFVYGGLPRLCMHVEENIRHLHLNPNNFIKIQLPIDNKIIKAINANWFAEVLEYHPDQIVVFRDNSHSTESSLLITQASKQMIPVVEIDDRGTITDSRINGPSSMNPYFIKQAGRTPNYDF